MHAIPGSIPPKDSNCQPFELLLVFVTTFLNPNMVNFWLFSFTFFKGNRNTENYVKPMCSISNDWKRSPL